MDSTQSKNLDALKKLQEQNGNQISNTGQNHNAIPDNGTCFINKAITRLDGCYCTCTLFSDGKQTGITFSAVCHNGNLKAGDVVHFVKTKTNSIELISGGGSGSSSSSGSGGGGAILYINLQYGT